MTSDNCEIEKILPARRHKSEPDWHCTRGARAHPKSQATRLPLQKNRTGILLLLIEEFQKLARRQNLDAAEFLEREQIMVAGDNDVRPPGDSAR